MNFLLYYKSTDSRQTQWHAAALQCMLHQQAYEEGEQYLLPLSSKEFCIL